MPCAVFARRFPFCAKLSVAFSAEEELLPANLNIHYAVARSSVATLNLDMCWKLPGTTILQIPASSPLRPWNPQWAGARGPRRPEGPASGRLGVSAGAPVQVPQDAANSRTKGLRL